MFDIGGPELIVIVLAIIILFGPKKLPEMVQMFTKGLRQFRQAQAQVKKQFDEISADMQQAANLDSLQELRNEIKEIDPRKAVSYKYQKSKDLGINVIPDDEDQFSEIHSSRRRSDAGFSVKPPTSNSVVRGESKEDTDNFHDPDEKRKIESPDNSTKTTLNENAGQNPVN